MIEAQLLRQFEKAGIVQRVDDLARAAFFFRQRRSWRKQFSREGDPALDRQVIVKILQDNAVRQVAAGSSISEFEGLIDLAAIEDYLPFIGGIYRAARAKNKDTNRVWGMFDEIDQAILLLWDGFEPMCGLKCRAPGLRFWTDRAAAVCIGFILNERSFEAARFKKRRLRLNVHPGENRIVTSAKYTPGPLHHTLLATCGQFIRPASILPRDRIVTRFCPATDRAASANNAACEKGAAHWKKAAGG